MSSALKVITGGPARITVEGKAYELAPLNPLALDELQDFVQLAPLRAVNKRLELLGDSITDEHRMRLIDEALKKCDEAVELFSAKGEQSAGTLEGVRFIIRLMLQRKQPDITDEEVVEIVTSANLEEWTEGINKVFMLMQEALSPKARKQLKAHRGTARRKAKR